MDGEAISTAPTKEQNNRWVYSDQSSMCVAVNREFKDNSMQV